MCLHVVQKILKETPGYCNSLCVEVHRLATALHCTLPASTLYPYSPYGTTSPHPPPQHWTMGVHGTTSPSFTALDTRCTPQCQPFWNPNPSPHIMGHREYTGPQHPLWLDRCGGTDIQKLQGLSRPGPNQGQPLTSSPSWQHSLPQWPGLPHLLASYSRCPWPQPQDPKWRSLQPPTRCPQNHLQEMQRGSSTKMIPGHRVHTTALRGAITKKNPSERPVVVWAAASILATPWHSRIVNTSHRKVHYTEHSHRAAQHCSVHSIAQHSTMDSSVV